MATSLSEEHEQELRKIFDDYDQASSSFVRIVNGSGDIDVDELRDIAEDLGEPLSEIELQYLAKEFDSDQSGSISWGEFIAWWKLPF
ncbi:hypothetical protein PINS_up020746 [Pythium insidiosum]|nr:hypothetical protein PINS_up020746 [Pythium insidiosum]